MLESVHNLKQIYNQYFNSFNNKSTQQSRVLCCFAYISFFMKCHVAVVSLSAIGSDLYFVTKIQHERIDQFSIFSWQAFNTVALRICWTSLIS